MRQGRQDAKSANGEENKVPYDDEIPPHGDLIEPPGEFDELARRVIGAAIEVHREPGPGMPEVGHVNALALEFGLRGIPYEREKPVNIVYKGTMVAKGRIDLLAGGKLVVEVKSIATITAVDRLQTVKYMRVISQPLGLLLNFNVPVMKLGIKRIIDSDFSSW
jgi:GxxExxY protein